MGRLLLVVLFLAAPAAALGQAGGSASESSGDAAAPESASKEIFPPEGIAWFFYEPGASGFNAVLVRVREAASPLGFRVQELDLSRQDNLAFLAEIHQDRSLRWMDRVELFVGARHLAGSGEILRFVESWKAGSEDIWTRPAKPPAGTQGGNPAPSGKDPDSANAIAGAKPGGTDPAASSKVIPAPSATVHVPTSAAGEGWTGWLKRYRFSLLALIAAILFLAISVRSQKSKEGNP